MDGSLSMPLSGILRTILTADPSSRFAASARIVAGRRPLILVLKREILLRMFLRYPRQVDIKKEKQIELQ